MDKSVIHFRDTFYSALTNSSRFSEKMFNTFSEAYLVYLKTLLEGNNISKDLPELEKIVKSRISNIFDLRLREEDFVSTLSDTVASYSTLAKSTGFGQVYQNSSIWWANWNNNFIEPVRDTLWRTPSHKIAELEKYSLFHYGSISPTDATSTAAQKTYNIGPLLIVYAFINRHYILDLVPEVSVVRNLLKQGFDIYATDWGTPSAYDKDLTIGHFVNRYMDKSVDLIRETTKSDKVSLFGYCWGGDLVLMYAALHPEKVKNVITIATPGDFSADDTLLSVWTKNMNVEALLDAFGNAPAVLINAAFELRNPIENIHKYPHFLEQPHGSESTLEFFATETWLYDSPPVIGEIYREFVKYCYQQNLFINNKMRVDGNLVDLKSVKAPYLNVVAQKDDLVAPASSTALNDAVGSKDKSIIEFPSGHVGLIMGQRAHKEVWPKVGEWLKYRS
ncbi:MAG TPA: alpha/beta fold hydrolase [Candidatus Bathyarchaeia archaeon]|nr:alpha/beta fold hydrolase [Candidatus Bathyarchaeia archaeon]